MKSRTNKTETIDPEPVPFAPRTFRVWELTAVYRLLGIAPEAARDAAVADLRMFPASLVLLQEEAA